MRNLLGKPPEHIRGSSAVYRRDRMMEQSDFASANVAGSVRRSDLVPTRVGPRVRG